MSTKHKPRKRGRPPKGEEKKVTASFRLTPLCNRFLDDIAELSGLSTAQIAEECLWEHLPKLKTKYQKRHSIVAHTPIREENAVRRNGN